jgi:hypothetical protein
MPEKHVAVDGVISTWGNGSPRYDVFFTIPGIRHESGID